MILTDEWRLLGIDNSFAQEGHAILPVQCLTSSLRKWSCNYQLALKRVFNVLKRVHNPPYHTFFFFNRGRRIHAIHPRLFPSAASNYEGLEHRKLVIVTWTGTRFQSRINKNVASRSSIGTKLLYQNVIWLKTETKNLLKHKDKDMRYSQKLPLRRT